MVNDDNDDDDDDDNNDNSDCYLKAANQCNSFRHTEFCLNCCIVGQLYWTTILLDCSIFETLYC